MALDDAHRRHPQPFLVYIDGADREATRVHAAGIQLMAGHAHPRDQFALMVDRRYGGEIGLVNGAQVRVIADKRIPFADGAGIGESALGAIDDERQDVALGDDIGAHRHQRPIIHHNCRCRIVAGDQYVGSRATHVLDAHFLGNAQHPMIQNLEIRRVQFLVSQINHRFRPLPDRR